jgi:hypothetical protein
LPWYKRCKAFNATTAFVPYVSQVQMLLEEGVAPKDIGVIAPYNAQV